MNSSCVEAWARRNGPVVRGCREAVGRNDDRNNDKWAKDGEARHALSAHRAASCPSWDRTRTLLIQSQACCQLHQGAPYPKTIPSARPGERGSKIKTVGSGEWYFAARYRTPGDRKSTRLNSSHSQISYAVFCLKKKKK